MPQIEIRQSLWESLVAVAAKQRRKPEVIAQQALREYLERLSDEELLEQSSAAARRAPFRMQDSEELVRRYRSDRKA